MAVFNELLVGRFNRALQKLTGIKGGPPVRQLGSEILPVFPIFWGAENRYLESWNRFAIANQISAVAAQNDAFQVRNPAGSNILVVIEKCLVFNANAANMIYTFNLGVQPNNLTTNQNAFVTRLDARTQTQSPAAVMSIGNNVAVPGFTIAQIMATPATTYDLIGGENQEITILPGDALIVSTNVNLIGNCSFLWRERFLEDSERA